MKPNKLAGVFLWLAVGVMALALVAAAQEKKPQLFFVEDDVVKPAMVAQFEAVIKEFNAAMLTQFNWPWAMETYATEDFHYYLCYPMASLTDLDKAFSVFNEILGKFGEQKWDALNRKLGDTIEYFKQSTITFSPELSCVPEKPGLKPEEMKFVYWGFCYVMPGREKEFEAQFKKIAALFKAKNVDHGFNTWVGGIGTELPLYIYTELGKSAADFFLTSEKAMKILDPEVTKLWNKTLTIMRKYEFKMGTYRPDLSYAPAAKAK
jgi:hypothetical protein